MRALIEKSGRRDVEIDSAGTGDWHVGELPDPRTRAAAEKRGYRLEHRARQFTVDDFDRFDLVVAMDNANVRNLLAIQGNSATPIVLLRSYDPSAPHGAEVPDPYVGGAAGFEAVLDQCERACAGLLASL